MSTELEQIHNVALLTIIEAYPDKGIVWAGDQLERCIDNIDCEPTQAIYDEILKGEFGIGE
jgi:hypothetical protein